MTVRDIGMSDTHPPRLEPETLDVLAFALSTVGVVGNEDDRRFDAGDVEASRQSLEERLTRTGRSGAGLTIDTLSPPHGEVDVLVYDKTRFATSARAERAWEQDYRNRRRAQVEERVADWLRRLRDLRANMSDWLSVPEFSGLAIVDREPAIMSEGPMRQFDVGPRSMPVFEVHAGARRVMRFQPAGLWVIGANGRVDLVTRVSAPILVDQSAPLARPSAWSLYDSRRSDPFTPLDAASFRALIRAGL